MNFFDSRTKHSWGKIHQISFSCLVNRSGQSSRFILDHEDWPGNL